MSHRVLVPVLLALAPTAALAAPDPDWQREALGRIAAAEYRFTWQDGRLQAPNRAQGFRTRVADDGVSIESRTRGAEGFRLGLALVAYGLETVAPGIVDGGEPATNRRDGISEWVANDATGLTHGFVLERPPTKREGPVTLRLRLEGAGAFPEGSDGKNVLLRNGKGEAVVRYGALAATDAVGEPVPAAITLEAGSLVIVVDDGGAAWPITVHALASSPLWSVSIEQAGGGFGNAVSTAGDVNGDGYSDAIVAAYAYDEGQVDEGKVFVFPGTDSGLSPAPVWSAQSDQAGANMGSSVSAAGDVNGDGYGDVVVGTYLYDLFATDGGAVSIWLGGPGGLGANGTFANADWTTYGFQAFANLGVRVARAGDVNRDGYDDIIAGAWGYDNGTTFDDGAAFVYHGGPAGPPTTTPSWSLVYMSDFGGANFGIGVAGAGDVNADGYDDVVVGAYHDRDSAALQGSIHLYYGSSTGLGGEVWSFHGAAFSLLGASVAGLGDVNGDGYADIGAGAPTYDTPPFNTDDGRLFVFFGRSTIPDPLQNWSYSSRQDGAQLGTSMAAAGDVNGDGYADVIAGAELWDTTVVDEGRAFVFHGSAAGPATIPSWWADGGQAGASLGVHVGSAGDVNGDGFAEVIVGSYRWNNDIHADAGIARVYMGGPGGPKTSADWSVTPGQAFEEYGWDVAAAGDVNGDLYSDVVVGAPKYDNGNFDEGAAFVYHGSPDGLSTVPAFAIEGGQDGAWVGFSVGGAGDVNGDGYGDVIAGGSRHDSGHTDEGVVYVYTGGPSGLTGARQTFEVNQTNAQLGWSVAGAGDVNGDGYGDVVMGAELWDGANPDQGAAYVALGSASGLGAAIPFGTGISQTLGQFGFALASAGDVNRDGFSDVIVGAPEWDGPAGGNAGKVFLFLGSAGGLSDTAATWSPDGGVAQWRLGSAVAPAGDVNGDGYADVIIGVSSYSNGQPSEGGAFVYHGGPSGPTSPPVWSFQTDQANAFLGSGTSVGSAGDVNGDGYSDVVVGAPSWQEGFNDFTGKAWVFLGSASGLSTSPAWSAVGGAAGNQFGFAVGPAGDVDGDGYSDVLVGEWVNSEGGSTAQGKAHVFYGNGGHGRPHAFIMFNGALSRRVAPLGMLDSDMAFRPGWFFAIPAGRMRMGIQLEAKPVGVPFNGTGLVDFGDIEVSGASIGVPVVSGLSPLTVYHWRVRFARGAHPAFVRTPWFGLADLSRNLADFRTPCANVIWHRDFDGDLHGNPSVTIQACTSPAGYVANNDDCDDNDAARFPGNPEICDTVDNNCDGQVDNVAAPTGVSALTGHKSDVVIILTWTPVPGATRYTTARGTLGTLRSSSGDYTTSQSFCLADQGGFATDNQVPALSDGFWYVNRPVNCNVPGTYDEGVPSQSGSRDAEIAASPAACP